MKTLSEGVSEIICTTYGEEYKLISNDVTTHDNESVSFIRLMNEKSASLYRYLIVETEDLLCANIVKRTHKKDHVVKVNDNIDNSVCVYDGSTLVNNGVHANQVIENDIEEADLCKDVLKVLIMDN